MVCERSDETKRPKAGMLEVWKCAIGRSHTDSRFKLWIHIASLKTSNIPFAWFLVLGCNRQAQRTGGYVLSREVRLFVFPFPHRHEKEHPNTRFARPPASFLFNLSSTNNFIVFFKQH